MKKLIIYLCALSFLFSLNLQGMEGQTPWTPAGELEIKTFIANEEEWITREMDQKNISRVEAVRAYKAELNALKSLCEQRWD